MTASLDRKPLVILIGGIPGSGKSTTAIKLAAQLGAGAVISTDEIRDVMKIYDRRPILHGKTHDRWRLFGRANRDNIRRGLLAHSQSVKPGVMAVINKNVQLGETVIIEGVHLLPSLYTELDCYQIRHFILQPSSPQLHQQLLAAKLKRRCRQKGYSATKLGYISTIGQKITEDALTHNIPIIPSGFGSFERIINILAGDGLKRA